MRSVCSVNRALSTCRTTAIVVVALGALSPMRMARAQTSSAERTAQWEQWALSIPSGVNPQIDSTGANCMVGQRGNVWLLAGAFFGGAATRSCSIPEGATLFFPVVNSVQINVPKVCGAGAMPVSVEALRQAAAAGLDSATYSVEVDGKANVSIQRIQSTVFAVALPAGNVFESVCGGPGSVPAGIYSPAVDDGYYVMLDPLKPGKHTIHIHAQSVVLSAPLDITYNLTVVRVSER